MSQKSKFDGCREVGLKFPYGGLDVKSDSVSANIPVPISVEAVKA
jgi:hypothetical protein